jgi:hypothetical protein
LTSSQYLAQALYSSGEITSLADNKTATMFAREITRDAEDTHADSAAFKSLRNNLEKLKREEALMSAEAFPFELFSADKQKRNYTLVAPTAEERGHWIKCINELARANSTDMMINLRNNKIDSLFKARHMKEDLVDSGGVLQLKTEPSALGIKTEDLLIVGRTEFDFEYCAESRVQKFNLDGLSRHHFAVYCNSSGQVSRSVVYLWLEFGCM